MGGEQDDGLGWLTCINKASLVALVESDLIAKDVAGRIARAINEISGLRDDKRGKLIDYLAYEGELAVLCGEDASKLHVGRSRIDINRTRHRLIQRSALLNVSDAISAAGAAILSLANQGRDAIVPTYTLGVQAQPTSFGHYLSGFANAFARDADRLEFIYRALNHSPLGAAAAITSTFPINRKRLAELLGFAAPVVNSFDAVHIAPLDSGLDLTHLARSIALLIDLFLADHAAQYRSGSVWLEIDAGDVGGSSLMPHKRNPDPVNTLRRTVGELLGACTAFEMLAHNVAPGTTDYAGPHPADILQQAASLLRAFAELLGSLRFDASVALQVVRSAGGASTELMNVLIRRGGMAPRAAHDLVSLLIDRFEQDPAGFHTGSFAAARELFGGAKFPIDEPEYYAALDPSTIVHSAAGFGGPQPPEAERMLRSAADRIANDRSWNAVRRGELEASNLALEKAIDLIKRV